MKRMRKYGTWLLLTLAIILAGRKIFIFFKTKQVEQEQQIVREKLALLEQAAREKALFIKPVASKPMYNFSQTLFLIEQTGKAKRAFNQVMTQSDEPVEMNDHSLSALLGELYREKVRFDRYANSLKRRGARAPLSVREQKKLVYYQRVIDRCIAQIEYLIRHQ